MTTKTKHLSQAALLGALYAVLTHMQNFILPGSASWAIQFRAAEALCVVAFFTPAAAPGLGLGCLLFNLTSAGALPADFLVGSLATFLACLVMHRTRRLQIGGLPLLGLLMPALFNGVLVGWELTWHMGGGFWLNAAYVAAGELAVLLTLGVLLYRTMTRRFPAGMFD